MQQPSTCHSIGRDRGSPPRWTATLALACGLLAAGCHGDSESPGPAPRALGAPVADLALIDPNVGVGGLRFGLDHDAVIDLLGEPGTSQADGQSLVYPSRGISLGVSKRSGLGLINCLSRVSSGGSAIDFPGKTKEGIGIGSDRARVLAAYGPASDETKDDEQTLLSYNTLGTTFLLVDDRVVQITLRRPRPKSKS